MSTATAKHPPATLPYSGTDSFREHMKDVEDGVSPMTRLQIILEKKGEDRSFDELLVVRMQTSRIPCLKAAMGMMRPTQIDELCRSMQLEYFPARSIVFRQGDVGDKFYVILQGSCDIRVKLPADSGGGEVVSVTYHDGQQFGERALDYDEPRAATVETALDTHLISFNTIAYKKILRDVVGNDTLGGGSTKARIMQIMSKNRNSRKRDELASVVSHICPRVQFLQKFTYEQQIELFRVCDFVTLWGKTTLFKQGNIGQAYYIVVSGHVDVFVSKIDSANGAVDMPVATIHPGNSFGEKALENEDSKRTATCITCDAMTELLVIGREEYKRLVVMVQQKDFADKVALLRRTHPFQSMDLDALLAIGQLMDFRSWRVNSIIYVAGELSTNFFILNTGEFGVKTEVFMSDGSSQVLDFGRVGPAAVLAEYSFQSDLFSDEVLYRETVTANTNCTGFTVSKYDMFNRLPREHYEAVVEALKNIEPPKSDLWGRTPRAMNEMDWKIRNVWTDYRKDVLKSFYHPLTNRTPNILDKAKGINKTPRRETSDNNPAVDIDFGDGEHSVVSMEEKADELTSMAVGISSPNARAHGMVRSRNAKRGSEGELPKEIDGANVLTIHEDEEDEDFFEAFGGSKDGDNKDSAESDIHSKDNKQVSFLGPQMGSSMSFDQSPPGSPQSRPSSRGHTGSTRTNSRGNLNSSAGKAKPKDTHVIDIHESQSNSRAYFALPPSLGSMRQYTLQSSKSEDIMGTQGMGTVKTAVASNVFRPPFCLIQLHREKLKMRPIQGSRRMLKCYFRVCGLVATCNQAKLAAESQMLNISVRMKGPNNQGKHYAGRTTLLNWNRFSGFSTMPLQNTDHFLIYCRGSPIEYASFTPPVGADLLDAPFPNSCKPTGQQFACLSVYRISAPRPKNVLYGEEDIKKELAASNAEDPLVKPLLLKEMSAVVEAMCTTSSRLDALRYAFNLAEKSEILAQSTGVTKSSSGLLSSDIEGQPRQARWTSAPDPKGAALRQDLTSTTDGPHAQQRLITVPLFVWLHISEDTFRFYDHAEFTADEISNEDKFIGLMRNRLLPRQDMAIAVSELDVAHLNHKSSLNSPNKVKSVSEELRDAIASVGQVLDEGMGKMKTANGGGGKITSAGTVSLNNTTSTAILQGEKANRVLHSTVDMRLRMLGSDPSVFSQTLPSTDTSLSNDIAAGSGKVTKSKDDLQTSSIEFKIQALKDNIALRQKVFSLNDELCKVETKLKIESGNGRYKTNRLVAEHESITSYDPNGDKAADVKFLETPLNPVDVVALQKRLVEKRLEILDALQVVPHNKFYSDVGDTTWRRGSSKNSGPKSGGLPPQRRGSGVSQKSLNSMGSNSTKGSSRGMKKLGMTTSSKVIKKRLGALETISTLGET